MKRELKVEGLKKMMEVDDSHVNYLCDVIEEIMLVDKRATRLLYPILDKLGVTAFYDPRLEEFVETHVPNEANYRLLLDWNTEIQREPDTIDRYILVKKKDIRTIDYIIGILSESKLANQIYNIFLQEYKNSNFDIELDNIRIVSTTNNMVKLTILNNVEYRMDRDLFFSILNILRLPKKEYYYLELIF